MESQYEPGLTSLMARFDALQHRIYGLCYAQQIIGFDGETVAPPKGVGGRAEAFANLTGLEYEARYGGEAHELVEALAPRMDELSGWDADCVRVFARDLAQMESVPQELCTELARARQEGFSAWRDAKLANDYSIFKPHLQHLLDLTKRKAQAIDADRDPYDVMLDLNERGLTSAQLEVFFSTVQQGVCPLVKRIQEEGVQPNDDMLSTPATIGQQKALADDIAHVMALDTDALYIGETEHPFTDAPCSGDVRIAAHYYPDAFLHPMFTMLHEGGHALYEQGIDPALDFTVVRGGVSMGIHESQSRFYENMVGLDRAFTDALLPVIRRNIPAFDESITADDLYRVMNMCQPGPIRTVADELTYPLHILVRFRMERAFFDGSLSVDDAPAVWRELMRDILGVDVKDDATGLMQDVHWSQASFGYFPSYAIGSAYAAQYARKLSRELDFPAILASGDLSSLNAWLRERIWRYGSARDPQWLFRNACGEDFDPSCYVDYLVGKYTDLYFPGR